MAFLGSLGKALGISTPEAARIATSYATGGLTQAALTTLTSLGEPAARQTSQPVDVSAPPAGVDSPATLSTISQTSGVTPLPTFRDSRGVGMGGMRTNQAFIGGFGVPGLIGQAGRLLSRPSVGGALTGLGAGAIADFFVDDMGRQKKLIITRKLQRDTKKLFMMAGGNLSIVSQQSLFFLDKDLSEEQILMILFKTFKNQGPYVTKAAVRKTRQTIRKLDTLEMLKAQMCPPKRAPARRRMPAKSTTITNVR